MKTKINYEALILIAINKSRRPMNISDIKRKFGFTRKTAQKYANRLVAQNLININKTSHSHWYSKLEVKA